MFESVENTNKFNAWGQWATAAMGVDPGKFGGCCYGSSIENCKMIDYPRSSIEVRDFQKNCAHKWNVDIIGTFFLYEKRPITDRIAGGAKRVYHVGWDDALWHCVSSCFHQKYGVYPQTWRSKAFPTLDKSKKPKGGDQWKALEWNYCKFFTGSRLIPRDTMYKSDHYHYGIAAAFCIWLVAAEMAGILRIKEQVERYKEKGAENGC